MKGQHFFYVGLGVLLLALLVACGQVPIAEPETGQQPAPVVEVVVPQTEEQLLPGDTEATSGSAFYAANPELMIASRYPTSVEEKPVTDSAFLANNPELMIARRYIALENKVDPDSDIGLLEFFKP